MNPIRALVPALLALSPAVAALDATAADFGIQPVALGAGARALGMGGAFSAVADDATAVTWNPAGLTQCERPEVALSLGWYHSEAQTRDDGTRSSDDQALDHVSGLVPFFAFGCQQVVGVAWQRQYDFTRALAWREDLVDIPNDFELHAVESHDSDGSFATLGLSYAIEVHPGLSLGVTINRWDDAWTGASHYNSSGTSQTVVIFSGITQTQLYESTAEMHVVDGTSLVLGGFWQAAPALTLAVVAKPTYELHLEHQAQVHSVTDDGFGNVTDTSYPQTTQAMLRHPSSLTLGAAWRHDDLHTVSCEATATRWSQYRVDDGVNRFSPVNLYVDPADFADLWTLRLGYEYVAILPQVILVPRLGLLLEDLPATTTAPSLSSFTEVEASYDRWWGATAGLSVCQRRWIWDLGAQVRYGNDVGAGQYVAIDQTVDMLVTTVRLGLTVQF